MRRSGNLSRCPLLAPLALLALCGGCRAPRMGEASLVSASPRRDGDFYAVMAVLRNSSPRPLSLEEVRMEVITFGEGGRTIGSSRLTFRGEVEPYSSTRLPLNLPDRKGEVRSSRIFLEDRRGRSLSELEVPPLSP